MKTSRRKFAQCLVVGLIGIVLASMCLPMMQTVAWVGSTDLEVAFLVFDAVTGKAISDATIEIHSEGGLYADRDRQDFTLVTGVDGSSKRLCRNCMCFGRRGWKIDTYIVHLPWWSYRVSAPGYARTEITELDVMENVRKVNRGKPAAKLLVVVAMTKSEV